MRTRPLATVLLGVGRAGIVRHSLDMLTDEQ
jgi:hypothetical protein